MIWAGLGPRAPNGGVLPWKPHWNEHRLFDGPDTNVNLHTFSADGSEIQRMLAFRDRLRTNPEGRALYESTKRKLAARTWAYMQDYADAKGEVVEAILRRALGGDIPICCKQ